MKQSNRHIHIDFADEDLACRAQAGSNSCFAELVRRYSMRLLRFVAQKVSHPQDAEDLVQDTFVKAYSNLGRYRKPYRFRTWLYTIASRLIIDHYRVSRKTMPLDDQMISPGASEPCELLAKWEETHNLWMAAKRLPPKQHDVMWLKYMEGMTICEIARVLQMTQINVRVSLHRARRHLAQKQEQPGKAMPLESRPCFQERI
jgi:RNA polymerase sigma-70 factor (ECF subfamily)